jgi:hypothetical protein
MRGGVSIRTVRTSFGSNGSIMPAAACSRIQRSGFSISG